MRVSSTLLQLLALSAVAVSPAVCFTATLSKSPSFLDTKLQASRSGSSSSSSSSDRHQNQNDNDDDDKASSPSARLTRKSPSSGRFETGEGLKSLREDLESLRHNLEWAKALKDEVRIASLTKAITNGQNRDPYFMYSKALRLIAEARKMKDATQEEKDALTEKWSSVADAARKVLPEFQMEGLWVGK